MHTNSCVKEIKVALMHIQALLRKLRSSVYIEARIEGYMSLCDDGNTNCKIGAIKDL